jgi:hypothetical protein
LLRAGTCATWQPDGRRADPVDLLRDRLADLTQRFADTVVRARLD